MLILNVCVCVVCISFGAKEAITLIINALVKLHRVIAILLASSLTAKASVPYMFTEFKSSRQDSGGVWVGIKSDTST